MTIPSKVLVATDFGPCSQRAVEDAFELAARLGAKVHVVHAFGVPGIPDGASFAVDAIEEAKKSADRKMTALVAAHEKTGLIGQVVVRMGEPAEVVLRMADELSADLIVVGTHGRKGITRLLIGSVAETIVRRSHIPVLVARIDAAA